MRRVWAAANRKAGQFCTGPAEKLGRDLESLLRLTENGRRFADVAGQLIV